MTVAKKKNHLSNKDVTEILNNWSKRGWFRPKKFTDSIQIDKIEATSAYCLALSTQYESRQVETITQPYMGGSIDNVGTPPNLWDMVVSKPKDFQKRTVKYKVPHTDSVFTCTNCSGRCRVSCGSCSGQGWKTCFSCGGSGRISCSCSGGAIEQARQESVYDSASGEWRYETRYDRVSCSSCSGMGYKNCDYCMSSGRETCSTCSGCGNVNCSTCAARGKLISSKQLIVKFEFAEKRNVKNETPIPQELIKKAKGNTLLHKRKAQFKSLSELNNKKLETYVLEMIQTLQRSNSTIIFQELNIIEIPLVQIDYRQKNKSKKLWIYGEDRAIFFEGSFYIPKNARTALLVAGVSIPLLFSAAALFTPSTITTIDNHQETNIPKSTTQSFTLCNSVKNKLANSDLNYSSYQEIDSLYRDKYPHAPFPIDKQNSAHQEFALKWCQIADEWIDKQAQ